MDGWLVPDASRYLRVKNWADLQHYRDRNPPWIKLYAKLRRDDEFQEMDELVQYQLIRIWTMASESTRFTADEKGRHVPVVADDERTLRRGIGTLKKIPLAKFVRDGWLIPVAEEELIDPSDASAGASEDASPDASALLGLEVQRVRGLEDQDPRAVDLPHFAQPSRISRFHH